MRLCGGRSLCEARVGGAKEYREGWGGGWRDGPVEGGEEERGVGVVGVEGGRCGDRV